MFYELLGSLVNWFLVLGRMGRSGVSRADMIRDLERMATALRELPDGQS
jgi:hypothetical protein